MNEIVIQHNGDLVTTSLIIAEGTENQHKNVLELIKKHQSTLEVFGRVAFETRTFETNGGAQQQDYAILNEKQSTLLITLMRNSEVVKNFKVRLVEKFYELLSQKPEPIPALEDPGELRRLLALYVDRTLEYEPKVKALERIESSPDSECLTTAAKTLGLKPFEFINHLAEMKWIYKRGSNKNWVASQYHINLGYLENKFGNDSSGNAFTQARLTPKGIARLAQVLN
jgi:phage antirepressor YoqD-like protein